MSFKVIKPGLAASWQSLGRSGLGHLGVGRGGAMDRLAAMLANKIVWNLLDADVYEMHFPAPVLEFDKDCLIALCGGDFGAQANGLALPINRRIFVPGGTRISFKRKVWGARVYLAFSPVPDANSEFQFKQFIPINRAEVFISKWFINPETFYSKAPIRVLYGPEWDWLSDASKTDFFRNAYTITNQSNRMGYQLKGPALSKIRNEELMSSGVLPGTIQLLTNGQPLLLMADCQTTGGYPRILQVIEADLPRLAQLGEGESLIFEIVELKDAFHSLRFMNNYVNSILFLNNA